MSTDLKSKTSNGIESPDYLFVPTQEQLTSYLKNIIPKTIYNMKTISVPTLRGESYTLKSIGGFNFTLQYDKASGKLVLDSQSISSTSSSSYYFACAAGVEGYAHTELSLPSRLRSGLVNVTENSNPFTFYFADKASQENTSLIIWAYSSDEYSTSGLMGYWSWYNSILMVKENESN